MQFEIVAKALNTLEPLAKFRAFCVGLLQLLFKDMQGIIPLGMLMKHNPHSVIGRTQGRVKKRAFSF